MFGALKKRLKCTRLYINVFFFFFFFFGGGGGGGGVGIQSNSAKVAVL